MGAIFGKGNASSASSASSSTSSSETDELIKWASFGRLAAIVFGGLALATTGGLWMGNRIWESHQARLEESRVDSLRVESRALEDQLYSTLDTLAVHAESIFQMRSMDHSRMVLPKEPILHWGYFEQNAKGAWQSKDSGSQLGFRGFEANSLLNGQSQDQQYLDQVEETLSKLPKISQNTNTTGPINPSVRAQEAQNQSLHARTTLDKTVFMSRVGDWISVGFKVAANGTSKNGGILTLLVDGTHVFQFINRFSARGAPSQMRAYLVFQDGQVINHSQTGFINANLAKTPLFRDALSHLFNSGRVEGRGVYESMDGNAVTTSYLKAGSLPLGVVVESLPLTQIDQIRAGLKNWKIVFQGGMLLTVLGCLGIALALWVRKKVVEVAGHIDPMSLLKGDPGIIDAKPFVQYVKDIQQNDVPAGATSAGMATPVIAKEILGELETLRTARESLRREVMVRDRALELAKEEMHLVSRFEREAARLRDPKMIAQRLAQTSSMVCQAKTMFFTFSEHSGVCALQSIGGFHEHENPMHSTHGQMLFQLDQETLKSIVDAENKGELISLAGHGAISKVILSRIGTAHFEAWPVTGYGHLGRQGGRAKLLGILVILESGVDSLTRHDSINRMMRATGLVYENTLLSQ